MHTDFDQPSPHATALAELCDRAVAEALRLGQPDVFLAWMQEQADTAELADLELEGDDRRRMLYWLGRSIWDGLPQPEHHFKPRPLPPVRRNEPCPCGSGRKFKQCCAPVQRQVPALPPDGLERAAAASLDAAQRQALAGNRQAPLGLKLAVAEHLTEVEGFEGVPELLLPVFESAPARGAMDLLLPALDLLVEALEAQGREPEADSLARQLSERGRGPLAGYGHSRLAAAALLAGDAEEALRRTRLALKADRSDPRPAALEISALVALDRIDEARATAAHWHREALAHWPDEADFIHRMERYRADAHEAHPDRFRELPEGLRRLQTQVTGGCARPAPRPLLEAGPASERDGEPARPGLAVALAEAEVAAAEADWLDWLDVELEFEPEALAAWLEQHPAALDSPVVLEAMMLVIEDLHDPETEAFAHMLDTVVTPMLWRLRDIALDVLARLPEGHVLPREVPANRAVLGALLDHVRDLFYDEPRPDPEQAVALMRRLLVMDPDRAVDHAGQLAEMLLHLGRPGEALEVAEDFPWEASPALAYARLLALYRLDRQDEAAAALAEAAAAFPDVLDELLSEDGPPDEPEGPFGDFGSEKRVQEGWIYALRMGAAFAETPGLLGWLRRHRPGGTEG